jgi:hypothetical protein
MSTPAELVPDDAYCIYCHAPAAGPCAACGALCCGECVELRLGLTRQLAVCRDCIRKGVTLAGAGRLVWWAAAACAGIAAAVFWAAMR